MDKERVLRFLIKESLPHKLYKVLETFTDAQKTDLKKFIKHSLDTEKITRDEYNTIIKHTRELQEVKELQESLSEVWELSDNELPILAKESETGLIYPIEKYWINHELRRVDVSEYLPNVNDIIMMFGTRYELISPMTVKMQLFEVR